VTALFSPSSFRQLGACKIALVLGLSSLPAVVCSGQNAPAQQPASLSEKVSTEIQKLKPLQDAKNWDGMIALLDGIIPTVGPASYDLAFIQDMRARLLAGKDQWSKAADTMEIALKLSDASNPKFFDKNKTLEMVLFLAQINYQEATTVKVPEAQRKYLAKASDYIKRWLTNAPKPTPEIMSFYATVLLQQAVADPKNINQDLLKAARAEVDKLFQTSIRPKENLYFLLLAILQQGNDIVRSSEVLELIVKQFPTKKDYWPQLWATYLNLASDKTNDESTSRPHFIRAINTVERAQAQGFMNTPKDNFNLVSLYIQVNQFGKATDLLYAGLKNGGIENDPKNWIYLGYYYLQINRNLDALNVLKEATKLFPSNGQFDLQIGEIYRQDEKMKDARHHYKEALRKGGLDRPQAVHTLLANVSYELEDFDEAMKSIVQAEALADPKKEKDAYLARLKEAIQAAITDRESSKPTKNP
jgi:tetratricopeptide (TPR) repeat protein